MNYVPTFKAKHNKIKCMCWILLYDRYLAGKGGLKLPELVRIGNFNYYSLANSLTKWLKWGYIGYRTSTGGREYHIGKRGRDWIDRWRNVMPLKQYIRELETEGK